jgi:TolA-binding protein
MNLLERVRDTRWMRLGLQVATAVVVLALAVAGGWAWYHSQDSRGMAAFVDATDLALDAQGQTTTGGRDKAIKALETLIGAYPRLPTIPQAAYQLGNLKYGGGQYGAARGAYDLALAKGGAGTVRVLAGMGIGYTWEAEKNYPNAAQAYQAVSKGLGPKDFMYEDALMAEARAQALAGKSAVALEIYQRLLRDLPDSRRAEEVRNRIASLKTPTSQ